MHLDFHPEHDVEISQDMPVRPEAIWVCWSDPALFETWFCLQSEQLLLAQVDIQPGGILRVKKRIQNGLTVDSTSCFLQAELEGTIIFTDALGAGFHPNPRKQVSTVSFVWEKCPTGTRVTVRALHDIDSNRGVQEGKNFTSYWARLLAQLSTQAANVTIRRAYAGTSLT